MVVNNNYTNLVELSFLWGSTGELTDGGFTGTFLNVFHNITLVLNLILWGFRRLTGNIGAVAIPTGKRHKSFHLSSVVGYHSGYCFNGKSFKAGNNCWVSLVSLKNII